VKVTGESAVADRDVENTDVESPCDFAKPAPMAPVAAMSESDHVSVCSEEFIPGLRYSIPLP